MENTPEKKTREGLIDAKVAGELLGVSSQTIYRWVDEKHIPFIKLYRGKRKNTIRFRESSLLRWIKVKENETQKERGVDII